LAGLPPRRKKLRPRKRGNAPALHAAPRCNANTSSSCKGSPCEAPALNENTRKRLSKQLGYDVPAGLCAHHVKEHARKFHGIPPTWNFAGARLCGKLTYKSRRTIPVAIPACAVARAAMFTVLEVLSTAIKASAPGTQKAESLAGRSGELRKMARIGVNPSLKMFASRKASGGRTQSDF